MLLDNENRNQKVHEWIREYTEEGSTNIVTGYFTVGALAYLSEQINKNIDNYKFILGDIVHVCVEEERPINLLNENITVDAALKLSNVAKKAVDFLQQDNVEAKTIEPNFCHAKAYIFNAKNDPRYHYFISGSSNLTEAGIGLKKSQNVELNIAETGNNNQYKELVNWFEDLWGNERAHADKIITDYEGNEIDKKPFKQYLIDEIKKIFIQYTPKDLYYKVLFELFGGEIISKEDDPDFNRQVGRLENTEIYNALYEFQRKGTLSLIKMLQNYNGAILADAVGLGKTWTALAVIKFFQIEGYDTIILCPKKLRHNWFKFKKKRHSRFESDKFDYVVRYHTDLFEKRLEKEGLKINDFFQSDRPKLFVIDESHNLRNDKSERYKFLVQKLLKPNENVKVLMLSATPINNSLNDIRNQFKLIVKGNKKGFRDLLGVRNLYYTFRTATQKFNEWREQEEKNIRDFIQELPPEFFRLTDSLTVARTRKMIQNHVPEIYFPEKAQPVNKFVTPKQIGEYESFDELLDCFPPHLCGYMPYFYVEQEEDISVLEDEQQRDFFLTRMMYILLVKRLESSWISFKTTADRILEHHQHVYNNLELYKQKQNVDKTEIDLESIGISEEEIENIDDIEDITLGNKREVPISRIAEAGNLNVYQWDLKKDIKKLEELLQNLGAFKKEIQKEKEEGVKNSQDTKLEILIEEIENKRKAERNNNNQKVVIFTTYTDTALYLYEQLKARGFERLAVVTGNKVKSTPDKHYQDFEPVLERFAPYANLYLEKEHDDFDEDGYEQTLESYEKWKDWIKENKSEIHKQLKNPIDILVATDCLSEGQNLQDCDFVVNYDIHWNPVRVIQRMGRIDRLGSINDTIYGLNFWPSTSINEYLDLQDRVEDRMAAMRLAGSEINKHFTEQLRDKIEDKKLDEKQQNKMLKQMKISWDDIEVREKNLGFEDFSLETFRQDLYSELEEDMNKYKNIPNGVYTGFDGKPEICTHDGNGIIALLGNPSKPPKSQDHKYEYYLIYIDKHGTDILANQKEILEALSKHKDCTRSVPVSIDQGDEEQIEILSQALKQWIQKQGMNITEDEEGKKKIRMGESASDILDKLKRGDQEALEKVSTGKKYEEKFQSSNFDLIVWFIVH